MRYTKITAALTAAIGLAMTATAAHAAKPPAPNLSNAEFQQCLDRLQRSSTFRSIDSYTFNNYRPSEPDPSVIQSLNYQPEFQKDVWDYLSVLVDKERVEDGIRAKHEMADTLRQIEARYGVKAEHVLGVWGVESNFGQTLGKKDLFQSLATLSCFDRRQSYFRGEFANALKIVQNGDIAASDMTGSWAGAFGQTQFMPGTFLDLAVDFDGDGRRDLVNSKPDALASTANFLKKRGYRSGEPWGYEVKLPQGFWGANSRKDKKSMSYWRDKGLTLADGRPLPYDLSSAGLLLPAGLEGPAFLVGKNFDTFYSYNASENYALAIAHLSDLITKEDSTKTDFVTAWPTDDPGISRKQAKDIQQALIDAGYDIGNVDGIIGDNTRKAIQQYQTSKGVFPADGRAGQKFYRLIMGNNSGASNRSFSAPSTPVQKAPSATNDSITQLIEKQDGYRRIVEADGTVRLIRVDTGK
ncbi:lytic murein transglycosylase [Psychrobacter sp. FDAARGOS_221]|uniref:lytic murein transglycosylase n=1 Tax=Psychrobacter sp. FDAARGOS_221 TaxID=1975705 RepID=UPI000BB570EF|nr:lytic murein transglycosylase [Psychrobacter sp. FDAARGOS_221]PNK60473.1 lytic murein transglycosylase [Psychrobacter sp. FDAARGOS_221]